MVFNEAQVFGTKILTTETLSAVEMVQKTGSGTVCPNTDAALSECVEKFIRDFVPYNKKNIALSDNFDALSEFDTLIYN